MALTNEERLRYSRQIVLQAIGADGQLRLKKARVCVIGIGGLGCFSAIQLAAMGVGFIRLIDQDVVDVTNLHRQILYDTQSIGYPKVEVAEQRLRMLNSNIEIDPLPLTINDKTAEQVVRDVDVVIDGLDRFAPRRAVNRACVKHEIPYIYGGALETYGNVSTILPRQTVCFECFTGSLSDEGMPTCETTGVLTPILATIASIQVSEALHLLLEREPCLGNKVLFIDINTLNFSTIDVVRRDDCPICGTDTIEVGTTPIASKVVELCGKDSFMASSNQPLDLKIDEVFSILTTHYPVKQRSNLGIAIEYSPGVTINLMKTGNALIRGTSDQHAARKIYEELLTMIIDKSPPSLT
ncbi:MAG: HesA/MoeB/ThiF family protein [Candidatus Bathyarchaeota archaeon]|nr:MAG: HesA/MoeB/ThiF family protein [Candidatus Bathyarchaeota archaeon]